MDLDLARYNAEALMEMDDLEGIGQDRKEGFERWTKSRSAVVQMIIMALRQRWRVSNQRNGEGVGKQYSKSIQKKDEPWHFCKDGAETSGETEKQEWASNTAEAFEEMGQLAKAYRKNGPGISQQMGLGWPAKEEHSKSD